MTIPVIWKSYLEETPNRGYWDNALIEAIFDRELWSPVNGDDFEHHDDYLDSKDGSIVVIPARYHADKVNEINRDIAKLNWVIVILCGDEEAVFPADKLTHPQGRLKVWVMTPTFGKYGNIDRYLGDGWPTDTREILRKMDAPEARPFDWFFAGQVTHTRREECVSKLREIIGGHLLETPGFTQGMPRDEYLRYMVESKVIPCPSGPETPDTFRLYEALEAGCVPIADDMTPKDTEPSRYWHKMFGDVPFPVVEDWSNLPGLIENLRDRYPTINNRVFAWWQQRKRQMVYNLEEDVKQLSGKYIVKSADTDDLITILIPTSPIPSHPSIDVLEETIRSIRVRLPYSEIILMFDGVREQQEERRADYEEYIRRVLWKTNFHWKNVLPLIFDEHNHQANMTREALKHVKTPLILFVEHDTPLCEQIPFDALSQCVMKGHAHCIRLHHEALILDEHRHLMIGDRETVCGIPLQQTYQWSQRPHLASTDFYRAIIDRYFSVTSRTMIEDKLHGIVHSAYLDRGKAGWNEFKLWIYAPDGDMKRSYHTDGRQTDSKFEMRFE